LRAALDVRPASFRFWLASHGIRIAASTSSASQYPRRDRTETKTTYAATAKSRPPAIRAARFSVSEGLEVDRKRRKTTAAESSSFALSPPKAGRAGLRDAHAATSETAASTLIQIIVNAWSRRTRRETSGTGGDVAMAMGSPFNSYVLTALDGRNLPRRRARSFMSAKKTGTRIST